MRALYSLSLLLAACSSGPTVLPPVSRPSAAPASAPPGAPPARTASAAAGFATLVVANQGDGTVTVVDVATRTTRATLPMQAMPHEVATTSDGRWALVTNYGDQGTVGHTLAVIDVATAAVARWIDVAPHTRPHGVAFLPGDSLFVVTSETSRAVLVVGFEDGRLRRTLPTGAPGSHMLAVPADGRHVFAASIPGGSAAMLAVGGAPPARTLPLIAASEALAVSPDGRTLWSGSRSKDSVVVVDVATGARLAAFAAPGSPFRVTMSPDGQRAAVSLPMSGTVRVYSVPERRELLAISVPGGPVGGVIGPDNRTLYVALHETGEVGVVDLVTGTVTARLPVGAAPDGVGLAVRR